MKTNKILPPTYFVVSIILIAVIHFLFPVAKLIDMPWNLSGLLLILTGGTFNLLADRDFKRFKTTVKPFEYSTSLITEGVFRISRNPMYLGMTLLLLGETILLGSLSPFLIVFIFMFFMHLIFILPEEKLLLEKFGEEYIKYKYTVRRWI
jgi:protein-S-isoprenylcysteine O-methyltransferase Ste14